MFKRASSRLMRTGSKDSKDSDVSVVNNDAMVRIGRATKTGTLHANEDRSTVVETLTEVLDEEVFSVSEMLEFDLKNSGDLLEKTMYVGVFDGHGGSGCASYISKNLHCKIAKNLEAVTTESLLDPQAPGAVLKSFQEVEEEFIAFANPANDTSGSCAAVVLITGQDMLVAHTGDCRVVVRSCGETLLVTKDHRADDPVESARIIANGGVIVEGRLNGVLCPSRSFGDTDVKSLGTDDVLICTPDIGRYSVNMGPPGKITSFMILATDGLWDVMDTEEACDFVEKVLKKTGSADMAAAKLVETAGKHNHDDVTVIIVAWQRMKPSKEGGGSKLNMKARDSSTTASREASKDEGEFDPSTLASPKVTRKNVNPDAKIAKNKG